MTPERDVLHGWQGGNGASDERSLAVTKAIVDALGPVVFDAGPLPAGFTLVKRSTLRSVYRLDLAGVGVFFAKREQPRNAAESARFLFTRSRARAEFENLERLRAARLPVPEPVTWDESRSFGALRFALLVTAAIEPAAPLSERLDAATVAAAGALLRRLHEAGWFHRDYHTGNILVRPDGSLALVDLQKARLVGAVSEARRARDLALFVHDLAEKGEAARALAPALLDAYEASPALRERVEAATAKRRAERVASRAKRCVVRSTGFRIEARGDLRIYRRADVPLDGILAAVEAHRATVARGEGADGLVKLDLPTTAITRQGTLSAEGPGAAPVAVKEFRARSLLGGLTSVVRHRGREAWLAAHALLVRGIETPLPLALVEVRRLGLVVASFYISRWLERAEDAHLYVDRRFASGRATAPAGRARGPWGEGGERAPLGLRGEREAVRAFARFVARLHAEGIYHGDLKLPNFLVSEASPLPPVAGDPGDPRSAAASAAAPPTFALLDLDAVKSIGGRVGERRRAKNLAQIEDYARAFLPQVKRTHRAAFLREYGASRELAALAEAHVRERAARRAAVRAKRAARGETFHER